MSQDEAEKMWIQSAKEDWEVASSLMQSGKYNHALFFVQLTLEKLIKALHIKKHDDHPLFVHNLVLLAQKAELDLTQDEQEQLKEISSFNVSARYDTYKREFYNKATADFANEWFRKAEALKNKFESWL